jgi:hypothetical protein
VTEDGRTVQANFLRKPPQPEITDAASGPQDHVIGVRIPASQAIFDENSNLIPEAVAGLATLKDTLKAWTIPSGCRILICASLQISVVMALSSATVSF